MLEKSIQKKELIFEATLQLIIEGGFQSASMSKVAKLAKVSPATIYLYFKSKDDLIDQLYLKVKTEFTTQAFASYDSEMSVAEGFKLIWYNIAAYKLKDTQEAYFLSQCDNSPVVSKQVYEQAVELFAPLVSLCEKGVKDGVLKSLDSSVFYAMSIFPINYLVNNKKRNIINIEAKHIDQAFGAAWDSIRLHD